MLRAICEQGLQFAARWPLQVTALACRSYAPSEMPTTAVERRLWVQGIRVKCHVAHSIHLLRRNGALWVCFWSASPTISGTRRQEGFKREPSGKPGVGLATSRDAVSEEVSSNSINYAEVARQVRGLTKR
ncbi:hypothetical protein CERZMDRAFT_88989 [Cercospora zeae-maydis SCOH1-5]|uniref:Uncharacterized protein n=1 Tax=Cercospora zeae-maydis SCOH1-5 TaxID=717836 RepID=A0A6A6F3K3_9PEZI|nr:hypothetical protein CERZMDRAFT_88989 [Cercospora zeae-maydis SCOH1-5]